MRIAVFPGQGSQSIGMGLEQYNKYKLVQDLFKEAEEVSAINLKQIIFEGTVEDLKSTKNAQIAIMLTSVATLRVLEEQKQAKLSEFVNVLAGHSLGEYTALIAASALSFSDAVKLLKARGKAMELAVPNGSGGMLAIIGVSELATVEEIAAKASLSSNKICVVANNNSTGQVILSGDKAALLLAEQIAKEEYKVKIVKHLEVSGPFHSPLMEPAKHELSEALKTIEFKDLTVPVISNVTAKPFNNKEEIKPLLLEQIVSAVKWNESMLYAANSGVKNLVEIGPGKVLTGLMKRIDNTVLCVNIENEADFNNLEF